VREDWEARGSSDLYQRSLLKARRILETHRPEPLPDDVLRRIRQIVYDADRELAGG